MGGFSKPINLELEKYETLDLLINQPENFLHYMNLTENNWKERFG